MKLPHTCNQRNGTMQQSSRRGHEVRQVLLERYCALILSEAWTPRRCSAETTES